MPDPGRRSPSKTRPHGRASARLDKLLRRDPRGHTYVVPGVVEALRMIAEGQEKTTGTEWLDGLWGYERRLPAHRAEAIIARVKLGVK